MTIECDHKWKIMKEFVREHKNLMGGKSMETVYHLQCEKCGDVCSRVCNGAESEGEAK